MSNNKSIEGLDKYFSSSTELKNKDYFKNYFIKIWCKGNLSQESYKFIKELNKTDFGFKNKKVVVFINKRYKTSINTIYDDDLIEEDINREFLKIIDRNTNYYDISLGDVIFVLNTIRDKFIETETQFLIYAIKTLYTFFLEESINDWKLALCSKLRLILENRDFNSDIASSRNIDNQKIQEDRYFKYPDYLLLVGKDFFNINEYKRISKKGLDDNNELYKDIEISVHRYSNIIEKIISKEEIKSHSLEKEYIYAIELSLLFFYNRIMVKDIQNDNVQIIRYIRQRNKYNIFSVYSNLLNLFLKLIIEETTIASKLDNLKFYKIVRRLSEEDNSFFSIFMNKLYRGIVDFDSSKRMIDIINKDNLELIISNIFDIINEFSFSNIEILENSMIYNITKNNSSLEQNSFKYIFNTLSNKYRLENKSIDDLKNKYLSFSYNYFSNDYTTCNLENIFKYFYQSPLNTEIIGDYTGVVLDDADEGLFATILEDFDFPEYLNDNDIYNLYISLLSKYVDNTEKATRAQFYKINLKKLYEDIKKNIDVKIK